MLNTCKSNGVYLGVTLGALSGERVSNTWVTYFQDWDNLPKGGLIPDVMLGCDSSVLKDGASYRFRMGPRLIS